MDTNNDKAKRLLDEVSDVCRKHDNTEHDETETATFRSLLSSADLATFDTFRLDIYGNGMDGIENGDSIPCRHLDPVSDAAADAVGHRSLGGSDYNGGSLVRSNLKAFRALVEEETGEGEPLPIIDYHGGHGTDGVLILLDRLAPRDSLAPFVDLLRGLEDYPVVCEETMSELEHEEENEAWQSYAEADFAKELAEHIGQDTEIEAPDPDVYPDSVTLRDLFTATADSANLNGGPGVEHSDEGPYFMVDDAAAAVSPVLLFALGFVKLDADTILDLASSTDVEDHDDARRIRRIARLGLGLRQLSKALAREIQDRTISRKLASPVGVVQGLNRLSAATHKEIAGEAERQARDLILSAEIVAGDLSAPIGAQGLNRPQRVATVTLSKFVTKGHQNAWRTVDRVVTIDPAAPYTVDHEAIRDFVASF